MHGEEAVLGRTLRSLVQPLEGGPGDFDALLDRIGDARLVLLGEASHGTHEFYRIRSEITKRLIREKGFAGVAVEADWPDAYRVNRWVRGGSRDTDAEGALGGFRRFPQWMWRNADVLDFAGWLRAWNESLPEGHPGAGFYGLDLYSMHASMEAVLAYLHLVDPEAEQRARRRYACFEHFGEDPQEYGYAAAFGLSASCEQAVIEQLVDLHESSAEYARRDGRIAPDALFFAEQNARLVRNAERYYRSMFGSRVSSWNLRDTHMVETLVALLAHLAGAWPEPKLVLWAHNSHLGDARATDMGTSGELNVGQLVREHWGTQAVLVGFTTHRGTVTAANDWGEPAQRMRVRPALEGSYEALFHEVGLPAFMMDLGKPGELASVLDRPRLERAIGVIYRPQTERLSHYFHARLPAQFDVVLHYDSTRAVEPLERTGLWERGELAETYPTAL